MWPTLFMELFTKVGQFTHKMGHFTHKMGHIDEFLVQNKTNWQSLRFDSFHTGFIRDSSRPAFTSAVCPDEASVVICET
jgi:hypothetical protein